VELFEWRGEDLSPKEDGGIIRRNIQQGEGYRTPNDGAVVDGRFLYLRSLLFLRFSTEVPLIGNKSISTLILYVYCKSKNCRQSVAS
ncbi:hypothetical protein SK128_017561, partial [Halocaridina rubra]